MVKGKNIHLMEVPNFGLSKVGSGEEMHIPSKKGSVFHTSTKIGSNNQYQTEISPLGKEITRLAL